jgi:hypothetical protein
MIAIQTVSSDQEGVLYKQVQIDAAEDWKLFQELVQRGANLWPDAPPHIKEFADLVTNGKVMQDYYIQAGIPSLKGSGWTCAHRFSPGEAAPKDDCLNKVKELRNIGYR